MWLLAVGLWLVGCRVAMRLACASLFRENGVGPIGLFACVLSWVEVFLQPTELIRKNLFTVEVRRLHESSWCEYEDSEWGDSPRGVCNATNSIGLDVHVIASG